MDSNDASDRLKDISHTPPTGESITDVWARGGG